MYDFERWRGAIEAARSRTKVEAVLDEYRSALAPGDKVGFSKAAKSALLEDDIGLAATTLAREQLIVSDPATVEVMREVVQTFSAAAKRISVLEQSEPE